LDAGDVGAIERFQPEGPGGDVVEEVLRSTRAHVCRDDVVDLGEHERRQPPRTRCGFERAAARTVEFLVRVQSGGFLAGTAVLHLSRATREHVMTNLTLTVDEEVLKRARIRALEEGTSVNAIVRDYLAAYAGEHPGAEGIRRFIERARTADSGSGAGGRRWTREELHDRAPLR
jgi:hypothetical protein